MLDTTTSCSMLPTYLQKKSTIYYFFVRSIIHSFFSPLLSFLDKLSFHSGCHFIFIYTHREKMLILRLYLSKIPTYNFHFNSCLNSHFLLSRSGDSFLKSGNSPKKNSHFYLIESGNYKWEF